MCLNTSYRKVLVFSYDALDKATTTYNKLKNKVLALKPSSLLEEEKYKEYDDKFKEYISNDLNTSNAITLIYEVLKSNLNDSTKYELIKSWDKVLSLDLTTLESNNIDIDEEYIQKQIDLRNKAKQEKNYQLADQIRNDLAAKGIILKDTREATIYEINTNISHN